MSAPERTGVLNVNRFLAESKFNNFHVGLFICMCGLMTMDGYDLFVYGGVVPLLMKDFHLSPAQIGVIASYNSLGVLFGALIFGALADRIGRKKTILVCLVLFSVGMGLSGLAGGPVSLGIWRFVCGLGIGGSLPNIMAVASEYVPGRNRAIMVSGISSGIQVGGIIAAVLGLLIFPRWGWRPVMWLAALPLLLIPVYSKYLPDATTYLVNSNRLAKLREFMRKARPEEPVADNVTLEVDKGSGKVPLAAVFEDHRAYSTVALWVVYGVNLYVIFGFTIWLPKLMMNQGFSLASGLTFMLMLSAASIIGSFVIGAIADRLGTRPVLVACYLLSFASIALVAFSSNYYLLMLLVGLAGAGFNGAQNTINSYIPPYYPPSMRSTAMAYNYGLGRLGGIFGPALVGILMSMQFSYRTTVIALALPSLISAIGIISVREKYSYSRIQEQQGVAAQRA